MHELCMELSTPEMTKDILNWFAERLPGAEKFGEWKQYQQKLKVQ